MCLRIVLLIASHLFLGSFSHANQIQPETFTIQLIGQVSNADTAAHYQNLPPESKPAYLKAFWQTHNPLVYKYYYGHLQGERHYSVSDAYFESTDVLPTQFHTGALPPDSTHIVQALDIFKQITQNFPKDAVALNALGYALLESGEIKRAESTFLKAIQKNRKLPQARNGRGLAFLKMDKERNKALKQFQTAYAQDRDYEVTLYNQAICYIAIDGKDLPFHFRQVAKRFPNHRDAYFKLGVLYEEEYPQRSLEAYDQQIKVNPKHHGAYLGKGRVLIALDQPAEAVKNWEDLLAAAPQMRPKCLPLLLRGYQLTGETTKALTTASQYIRTLDEPTQALFRDIRFIASDEEKRAYETLPPSKRTSFELAFWQKRDPTPATRANERLVEHYRRVIYSLENFADHATPWDKRGDVYIRYGEPAHRSRHDRIRFETDPNVVKVKERLWSHVTLEGKKEIKARMTRYRSSMRDISDARTSDFESAEFETNPNSEGVQSGRLKEQAQDQTSTQSQSILQQTNVDYDISHRDLSVETIRGFPIFPVDGDKPWEYWIYPDIADGVEIVFASLTKGGDFDFPLPSTDRAETLKNGPIWMQKLPERIVASTVRKQSDVYRTIKKPVNFYFTWADFQSTDNKSRLEVYYGIPMEHLTTDSIDVGIVERGISIFDKQWKPLYQQVDSVAYRPTQTKDFLVIDQTALNLPSGSYYLGVQVKDIHSGRWGSYFEPIEVESYTRSNLMLSDLELASGVAKQPDTQYKNGFYMTPLPSRTIEQDRKLFVYYEIYGLQQNTFAQSHFRIDVEISPIDHGNPVFRLARATGRNLIGQSRGNIQISFEQTADAPSQYDYLELDLKDSTPGKYQLRLTITDLETHATANKNAIFWIVK